MSLKFERLSVADPKHEFIHGTIQRAKVPGGWFVCIFWSNANIGGTALTFYADPDHLWDGSSLPDSAVQCHPA